MLTLGELFAIWGEPLSRARMLAFRGPVTVFVAGRRVAGDTGRRRVARRRGVVVESGGYVEPHHTFLFPPRR